MDPISPPPPQDPPALVQDGGGPPAPLPVAAPALLPVNVGHAAAAAVKIADATNPTGFVLDKLRTDNPGVDDAQLLAQISNVAITPLTTASREGSGLLFHSYEYPVGSGNRFVKSEIIVRCTITKPNGHIEDVEKTLEMFTTVKWPTNEEERRAASEKLGRIAKGYCHFHTNVLDPAKRAATAGLAQKVADIAAGGAVRVGSPHRPGKKEPISAVKLTWGSTLESTEVTLTQKVDGLRHIITDQAHRTVDMGTVAPQEAGTKNVGNYIREADSHLVRRDVFHDSSDPYLMLKAKGTDIEFTDFGKDPEAVKAHAERLLEEVRADGAQAEQAAQRMLSRQEPGRIGKLLKREATWEKAAVFTVFKAQEEELTKAQAKLDKLKAKHPDTHEKVIAQQQKVMELEKAVTKSKQEFEGAMPVLRSAHHAQSFKVAQLEALLKQAPAQGDLHQSLTAALTEARATAGQTKAMMNKVSELTKADEASPITASTAEGIGLLLSDITGSLTAAASARERFDAAWRIADTACKSFDQLDAQYRAHYDRREYGHARELYEQQFRDMSLNAQTTREAAQRGWNNAHSVLVTLEKQIEQLEALQPAVGTPAHRQLEAAKTTATDFRIKLFAEYGLDDRSGRMTGLDVTQNIEALKVLQDSISAASMPLAPDNAPPAAVAPVAAVAADAVADPAITARADRVAHPPAGSLEETAHNARLLKTKLTQMEQLTPQMPLLMLSAGDQCRGLNALKAQIDAHLNADPPRIADARKLYRNQFLSLFEKAATAYQKANDTYTQVYKLYQEAEALESQLNAVQLNPFARELDVQKKQLDTVNDALHKAYYRDHSPTAEGNIDWIKLDPRKDQDIQTMQAKIKTVPDLEEFGLLEGNEELD